MSDAGSSAVPRPTRVRGFAFNAAFYSWTVLILFAGVFTAAVSPTSVWATSRFWAHGALVLLRLIVGLRHEIRGRENMPDEPVMLAVKHQSAWETLALNIMLHDPVFVMKQELLQIPFFGWMLRRAGMISVDRAGGAATLRVMVAESRARLADGRPLVIFPEGTRTAPGEHHPYHPGVAALYMALGVPVVPVALNSGLFWPRRSMRLAGGTIIIEFLPPIQPGLPRRVFAAQLEATIEGATEVLIRTACETHPHLRPTA